MATKRKLSAEMIAAGKALDVAAASKLIQLAPKAFYLNNNRAQVTPQVYVLAGLHTMRVANPNYFTVADVLASKKWLAANGWNVPA